MAQTIKQWVADRIKSMEKHSTTRKAKKQSQQEEESKMLEDWKKYKKEIANEIKMMYDNSACWGNIDFSNQCKIATDIVYELRMEEADGQS
jgi:hypothetical protein